MSNAASNLTIEIKGLNKYFPVGKQKVQVLKDINLTLDHNRFTIVFGPSGCGKSTLLHVMLGLETPSTGKVVFDGEDLYRQDWSEDERSDLRLSKVGMVYQQANWIKAYNVIENVAFPLILQGETHSVAKQKALAELEKVGMKDWAEYHPSELSSGQQQKVALARALINDPKIIVADEPTGNLDYSAGNEIVNLLKKLNQENNRTIIMVTHELEHLTYGDEVVQMKDGQVVAVHQAADIKKLIKDVVDHATHVETKAKTRIESI